MDGRVPHLFLPRTGIIQKRETTKENDNNSRILERDCQPGDTAILFTRLTRRGVIDNMSRRQQEDDAATNESR